MSYAIASKLLKIPTTPYLGYIQPYILEDGNKSRFSQPDDFPNRNSIFVSFGYEAIDNEYEKDDLFRIPYTLSDNYEPDSPNSCNYVSRAYDATKLRRAEYFHVLDKELDINDFLINVPYKPRRLIFISSSARLLYGPFDYDEPEFDPSSNTYKIKLKALQHLLSKDSMQDWSIYKLNELDFEVKVIQDQKILLANLEGIASLSPELVDYISDDQLLKWGNDLLQTLDRLPKKELRNYQELIESLPASDNDFVSQRRERLLRLIGRTNFWQSQRASLRNVSSV